jgi:hypothetical protein
MHMKMQMSFATIPKFTLDWDAPISHIASDGADVHLFTLTYCNIPQNSGLAIITPTHGFTVVQRRSAASSLLSLRFLNILKKFKVLLYPLFDNAFACGVFYRLELAEWHWISQWVTGVECMVTREKNTVEIFLLPTNGNTFVTKNDVTSP